MIPAACSPSTTQKLEAQGKTPLFVACNGELIGILGAVDTPRSEVPAALEAVRELGVGHIELRMGDNERATQAFVEGAFGQTTLSDLHYRAGLLLEDKINIIKEYQAGGRAVAMVGDGVNDAPALAQADVGIAMGAAGSDVAVEAAHVALVREDWTLVPEVFRIAQCTMRVVRLNIGFTAIIRIGGLIALLPSGLQHTPGAGTC
jgi:Cd2+/Zn2+-exporting ATPase/Cu+-exporting ATPase